MATLIPAIGTSADTLHAELRTLIANSRQRLAGAVNAELTRLYWHVGQRLRTEVLGEGRASYGAQLLDQLGHQLSQEFGRGFESRNLRRMVKFAEAFPDAAIVSTLSTQLSWSHMVTIVALKTPQARQYYASQAAQDGWSVRELAHQIERKAFERTEIANAQASVLQAADAEPAVVFKDPYFLDFLGLRQNHDEGDLEAGILQQLEAFILELGRGFAFVERQKRMVIDGDDFYLDLLCVELRPVVIPLHEAPDLKALPKDLRTAINDKVVFDRKTSTLTIRSPLTVDETDALKAVVATSLAKAAIEAGAIESRTTAIEFFKTPAEEGKTLLVPQLALRVQGELQLFDDPEVLDYPWALSLFDAKPTADNLAKLGAALMVSEGGVIDIDEASGKLVQDFMPNLQRDLGLAYTPEHWDNIKLVAWLCTNLPEPSLTHASKLAFVTGWLSDLLVQSGFDLARANLQKFQMRNLLEARIRELRTNAVKQAYQESLFGDAAAERVSVSTEFVYDFRPEAYAPSRDYDGRFGQHPFRKHFYSRIGDFDSKEEFECAAWLDTQAQKGRLQYWVRNLARREGASFFFQKATGRFYPDFVCKLNNESFLIVEYKGTNGWTDSQDDRDIGGLWAKLSKGTCQFVMIKEKQWSGVDCLLAAPHM